MNGDWYYESFLVFVGGFLGFICSIIFIGLIINSGEQRQEVIKIKEMDELREKVERKRLENELLELNKECK